MRYLRRYDRAPSLRVLATAAEQARKRPPGSLTALSQDAYEEIDALLDRLRQYRPDSRYREVYAETVERYLRAQVVGSVIREVSAMLEHEQVDEAVDKLRSFRAPIKRAFDVVPFTDALLTLTNEERSQTWPSGLESLDIALDGGVRKGELATFVGGTNEGKSFLLVMCGASAWKRGGAVLHVSLENTMHESVRRYLGAVSVPLYATPDCGALPLHDLLERLKVKGIEGISGHLYGPESAPFLLTYGDAGAFSVGDLDALIDELEIAQDLHPDVLVLDYADLLRAQGRTSNEYERLKRVYEELHALATRRNIAVWTATQANREGVKSRQVKLEHVAESFAKMFVCDIVITISSADSTDQDGLLDEERDRLKTLSIAKFRRGPRGVVGIVRTDFGNARLYDFAALRHEEGDA